MNNLIAISSLLLFYVLFVVIRSAVNDRACELRHHDVRAYRLTYRAGNEMERTRLRNKHKKDPIFIAHADDEDKRAVH
jgi:hypothetical protein